MEFKIFVLDDDMFFAKALRELMKNFLSGMPVESEIQVFDKADKFLDAYDSSVSLVFLDYCLEQGNTCEDLLKKIYTLTPQQKVVIISAQENGQIVLRLIRQGVRHYVIKDEEYADNVKSILEEELVSHSS